MKNNLKNTIQTLVLGLALAAPALAQVASNDPEKAEKQSYSALVGGGYLKYKDIYNPDNGFVRDSDGLVLGTFHSDRQIDKIKIFIPPGTKKFIANFLNYLSPEEAKASASFGRIPRYTVAEVTAQTAVRETQNTLKNLIDKKELRFYSPGGSGLLSISKPYEFDTFQVYKGGYIYLNVLSIPGGIVKSLQTRISVDEVCYREWFANPDNWDSATGNPKEGIDHTCPSIKTPDIAISPSIWQVGTITEIQPITISSAANPGIDLLSCTANAESLLSREPVIQDGVAQFTVKDGAKAITEETKATITCKIGTEDKAATMRLLPRAIPQTMIGNFKVSNGQDGKAELALTFNHTEAEYVASPNVSYWIYGKVPALALGPDQTNDEWFGLSTGTQWNLFDNNNRSQTLIPLVSRTNETINEYSKTASFKASLQFSTQDFKDLKAKIYLGYKINGGEFKDMGEVWDASNYSEPPLK